MPGAKILVVDDEPDLQDLINLKFRNKIKTLEYEFYFAVNGAEALEIIRRNTAIDLVLTDINMPVMDGLTLLSKINELNNKLLRSIIVSAYGDMQNIRMAMNRGAYDFITKPIDLQDLEITIEKSLKEIEEYKLILSAQTKLIALQQELNIANVIQTSILPKTFPAFPGRKEFDIYARMIPAREVGGDLYDFFFIDKYRLGVVIGDVSGKGIASALLMAVSKTLIRSTAFKGIPADAVLTEVNDIIVDESPANMFVTVFYGILDTRSGLFEYSTAGHYPPVKISNTGTTAPLYSSGGFLLGAKKHIIYQPDSLILQPGDMLFFFTDGVIEAFNKNDEQFEEARLTKILENKNYASAKELIHNVFNAVTAFSEGVEQSDDITCLTLKFTPTDQAESQ